MMGWMVLAHHLCTLTHDKNTIIISYKIQELWRNIGSGRIRHLARKGTRPLASVLLSHAMAALRLGLLLLWVPIVVVALCVQMLVTNKVVNQGCRGIHCVLAWIMGIHGVDDHNYNRLVTKASIRGKLIITNGSCVLDTLYFLTKLNSPCFLIMCSNQQLYQVVRGPKILLCLLQRQPYFTLKEEGRPFIELTKPLLQSNHDCVLFFEGIRTNGLGTVKVSKTVSNLLFDIEMNLFFTHLKYNSNDNQLFSLVAHPITLVWKWLGTFGCGVKVRGSEQLMGSVHSGGNIRDNFDSFLIACGSTLLNTDPQHYFQFLYFYHKTNKISYQP